MSGLAAIGGGGAGSAPVKRNPRDWLVPALIAAVISLACLGLHLAYLSRTHPDALYMDSLRLLGQLQDWQQGRMSFVELWGLGSAHRGFINPLAMLANIRFFSLDVLLANRMTGVVMSILVFTLLYQFNRRFAAGAAGLTVRLPVSLIMAALVFSWAGFELYTLDLGFPLWTKNLCFVVYFVCHATYLGQGSRGMHRRWLGVLLALAGALIVLFVGMGWSYAFVGAVLAVHVLALACAFVGDRAAMRVLMQQGLPAFVMLVTLGLSLAQGAGGGQGGDEDSFARLLESIPAAAVLVLHSLGAGWVGVEVLPARGFPLAVAGWMGVISLGAAAFGITGRLRRGLHTGSLLPFYLIAYSLLTALSLSAARGEGGPVAVMASRYHMDLVLFQVGVLWLLAEDACVRIGRGAMVAKGLLALYALGVVLAMGLTNAREWQVAPYRAAVFRAMNEALYRGVPDEAAAQLLQSPLEHARRGARILRQEQLALFTDHSYSKLCSVDDVQWLQGWNEPEGDAVWMTGQAMLLVPPCGCNLSVGVYLPADFQARQLHIVDGEGKSSAYALLPGSVTPVVIAPHQTEAKIRLSLSRATVPARDIPGGHDLRELGALWQGMAFECVAEEVGP